MKEDKEHNSLNPSCCMNYDTQNCNNCTYYQDGKCALPSNAEGDCTPEEVVDIEEQNLITSIQKVEKEEKKGKISHIDFDDEEEELLARKDTLLQKVIQFAKFVGPAVLVSTGYVDPGNWASDIDGGANYQYKLLWILVVSNILAILLQSLSAKIGLVTGMDLAQQCANYYPTSISIILWVLAELAIAATDLAEVLGTAIGLNLLFGIPMIWGVILTAGDTLIFLVFQQLGHRVMELFIFLLMAIISLCFVVEMIFSKPSFVGIMDGLIPRLPPGSLMTAAAIVGSVIMPHNLFLHSGLVVTRRSKSFTKTKRYIYFSFLDSLFSLNMALFVNASILIVSAATFYGKRDKPEIIQDAYLMLEKIFGKAAAVIFGIGLLAAGQSSTITGTLAGQMVMEGFIKWKMWPWLRRLITRAVAIVPAVIVILITGDDGTYLLLWSQVVLSIQLPFTMIPLIRITNHKSMGYFKNHLLTTIIAWVSAISVIALNLWLVVDSLRDQFLNTAGVYLWIILISSSIAFLGLCAVVAFWPLKPKKNHKITELTLSTNCTNEEQESKI